jgi:hypothetical protein
MERFGVRQIRNSSHMSNAEKLMGACAWCMVPVFAVVGLVHCASSANGMAVPRQSLAK